MPRIDQFESTFRSAALERLEYERIPIKHVLLVSDKSEPETAPILESLTSFLSVLNDPEPPTFSLITGADSAKSEALLDNVNKSGADMICTWRNLHSDDWKYSHGLGGQLDVLLQQASVPVLVMPHPDSDYSSEHANIDTDRVLALTDHLSNDHFLVNIAARLTTPGGTLKLVHIEDEQIFERYMDAISRISTIDTDRAREALSKQLLKQPEQYITTCRQILKENGVNVTIKANVGFGHHLSACRTKIKEKEIDLLVMNTKDNDQLAMHGLAYPLAVELREIPILML